MKKTLAAVVISAVALLHPQIAPADDSPVTIQIDAAHPAGDVQSIWRFFGYDEANFTYMPDGAKLLTELSQLGPQQVYIRAHHLLTSGDGTPALKWSSTGIYSEDANGKPIYNWTIIDHIFDTYDQRGLKPYVEIGFMPKDLSTRPDLYPSHIDANKRTPIDAGQAYPPKDYAKWGELIHQWTLHCIDRYGKDKVAQWYWEVWNEPDISYWKGKPADYYQLYDYAVDGVRRALPTARVGGPDSAGNDRFLRGFLDHCLHGHNEATGQTGSPLDFVSFHAKGSPAMDQGHVRMGLSTQLQRVDRNFAVIASFPELKDKPVVIGEFDPEGLAALPASEAPQNAYRLSSLFAAYEADAFARTAELAAQRGIHLEGALTWSFEFENKPYFIGYRVLATGGIDMPVLNTFRMLAKMSGQRLIAQSSADPGEPVIQKTGVRQTPDISAVASLDSNKLAVLVWNYHDDNLPAPAAPVNLAITGLPATITDATLTHYRIDQTHSNSYTLWKQIGSPQSPSPDQYKQLEQAGRLAQLNDRQSVHVDQGTIKTAFPLPRQAVSLLVFEWK